MCNNLYYIHKRQGTNNKEKIVAKLEVSINGKNEIVVNGGTLSIGADKVYVCDVCGDIVGEEVVFNDEFGVYHCGLCKEVLEKCQHCAYLTSGIGGVWTCDKSGKLCADVAYECEEFDN